MKVIQFGDKQVEVTDQKFDELYQEARLENPVEKALDFIKASIGEDGFEINPIIYSESGEDGIIKLRLPAANSDWTFKVMDILKEASKKFCTRSGLVNAYVVHGKSYLGDDADRHIGLKVHKW